MADDSDIQIISDHFTCSSSSHLTPGHGDVVLNNGTIPVEDRFRMYHGGTQPPSVNPASFHAIYKAYDDLKTRYNEVDKQKSQLERQVRLNNMAYRYLGNIDDHLDENELGEDQGFPLRRRYVELVQEHQRTLEEKHKYEEDLSQARKRIIDLENTNRGLLQDNHCMMVNRPINNVKVENEMKNTQIIASLTSEKERLNLLLQQKESELKESRNKCKKLQEVVDRSMLPTVLTEENGAAPMDSEPKTDENWARFAQLQVQIATKEAQDMRCIAQHQQALLSQLVAYISGGRTKSTLPSLMTRSAPAANLGIQADPNIVSVEVPSNAEQFPVILQPRGTTSRRQNAGAAVPNVPPNIPKHANVNLAALPEDMNNMQMGPSKSPTVQTGMTAKQTARPVGLPLDRKTCNSSTGLQRTPNGTHEAQQCTEDIFMENLLVHKNDILEDIIEEQRRQPVLPNKQTNPWDRYREPVGTVFGATSNSNSQNVGNENMIHPVRDTPDNELSPVVGGSNVSDLGGAHGGLQAGQQGEALTSLRRELPADTNDERTGFSLTEEFETTVQGSSLTQENERAFFTFELNENAATPATENRHHPAAFNQQPRQLNIDRNYNDELRRTGSYDNMSANRNINDAGKQGKSAADPYTPVPSNPPVLNNDPLWTPKTVPTQNLYNSHITRAEERNPPVTESQRICPFCDFDFPSHATQDEVQDHVNQCLNVSETNPEPVHTPTHGPVSTGAMAREQRKCPICNKVFPDDVEISRINIHANSHFDIDPFEIIEPDSAV